jgi:4-hydroxybenzoate-CoA ligase
MSNIYNAVSDLLDRHIPAGLAAKTAFIDPRRGLTYGELHDGTRRMVRLLASLGVRREERVALLMLDTVELPLIFLGAMRAGVVPVPLNTLLGAEQYAYMLADSRARVLFVSAALLSTIVPILERLPYLHHVVVVGGDATPMLERASVDFASALAAEPADGATAETHADEPAFWLYSSGSTGMPKGAKHVHASLMATADTFAKQVVGYRQDDVCLSAAKLFFAYGLGNALTFPMSVGATTILNPERPTPAVMFDLLERHAPTIFCGVPTLYAAMLNDRATAGRPGSAKLRLCVSAGEALPEQVGMAWKERFGADILDGVGSTEMLHIFLSNAPGDVRYGTSGRPVPGYEVRLVDENDEDVAQGEIGEMLVHGPSAAEGYWNQRGKSRRTFEGEWTRTGDKFVQDEDGRYTYCGRADDMFKVSGIWVSPFEVESALIGHPLVLEAAVVAAKDADGLVKPKAYVVLREGASGTGLQEALKEHVKSAIGKWKYPRWVEVVETLPKTATGKIQRFKLREVEVAE